MVDKVLVITNMYPSKRSKTFGIFVKNQVEALRTKGLSVDVVAVRDPRMGKVHVFKKYIKWFIELLYAFVFKRKQYDIIHAHYTFPSGFLGRIFQKWTHSKLVVTAHGGDIDRMARKNAYIYKQTEQTIKKADHIIAAGEALKHDIMNDFAGDENKMTVMSMGVDRDIFQPVQEAKRKLQLSENDFHILYVGNIIKAKGLYELLRAFQGLKAQDQSIHLHLIGECKEPKFQEELINIIESGQIQDVHFHSSMPQKELAVWMSASDLFVLPSHMEGLGLVAVEAMACHTPVIGTNVGGLAHLLKGGYGGLVDPHNVKSLQDEMKKMIQNPELRDEYIRKGEELATEHDHDKLVDRLYKLYEKIGAK